jgi:hypothetical protein
MGDRSHWHEAGRQKGDRCQWLAVARCPLYIASHIGPDLGCVDDMALPCRVSRGVTSYQDQLVRVIAAGLDVGAGAATSLAPARRA